jgi:hypothetical protein
VPRSQLQHAVDELKTYRRDWVNDLALVDDIMSDPDTEMLIRYQLVISAFEAVIAERQRGEDFGEEIPNPDFR